MFRLIIFIIVCIPFSISGYSQVVYTSNVTSAAPKGVNVDEYAKGRNPKLDMFMAQIKVNGNSPLDLNTVNGSPYPVESFNPGKIYIDDEFFSEAFLRYDAYNDEIQIKQILIPEEEFKALSKSRKIYCWIENKKYFLENFNDKKNIFHTGYLRVISENGDYILYLRETSEFKEGKKAENSMVNSIENRFVINQEYYLKRIDSEKIIYIPTRKKAFLKIFNKEEQDKLKKIFKEKKTNIKNLNELKWLLQTL